jgi:hypothetical protein
LCRSASRLSNPVSYPFHTVIQLARALTALGRKSAAIEQLRRAQELFSELKAELEVTRAEKALSDLVTQQLADRAGVTMAKNGGLTKREIEVLRLVAEGLSNQGLLSGCSSAIIRFIVIWRIFSTSSTHRHAPQRWLRLRVAAFSPDFRMAHSGHFHARLTNGPHMR